MHSIKLLPTPVAYKAVLFTFLFHCNYYVIAKCYFGHYFEHLQYQH